MSCKKRESGREKEKWSFMEKENIQFYFFGKKKKDWVENLFGK